MLQELQRYQRLLGQLKPDGNRFLVMQVDHACNRDCSYCGQGHSDTTTLEDTYKQIDWIADQGFAIMSYIGGEPFMPTKTHEGISVADHTFKAIEYASKKGLFTSITSNGDFIQPNTAKGEQFMDRLKDTGLASLTLSLHTYTQSSLQKRLNIGRLAASRKIIPAIQTVAHSENIQILPSIAAQAARNGLMYSFSPVQVEGDGFARAQDKSLIPSIEQQEIFYRALMPLKAKGFVRNGDHFLQRALEYYPNNWQCDPGKDTFIKVQAGGRVAVCSRDSSGIPIDEISSLDTNEAWRERKKEFVHNCGNCTYHCYYDAQNPGGAGNIPTIAVGLGIRAGLAGLVERWGNTAVHFAAKANPDLNYSSELPQLSRQNITLE